MNVRVISAVSLALVLLHGCGGSDTPVPDAPAGPSNAHMPSLHGRSAEVAVQPLLSFHGKLANYTLAHGPAGLTVTDKAGAHASVTVPRGASLLFADLAVATDRDGVAPKIYRLYQAALDRVPDSAGLGFHISAMEKLKLPFEVIARGFVDSPEFATRYGPLDNEQFVTQLYRNVLRREPQAFEVQFYVDLLDAKTVTRAIVLTNFSESPENIALTAPALTHGVVFTPYVVGHAGSASTLGDAKVAWNVNTPLDVVLRDERGTAVPGAAVTCMALNPAVLEVSPDCRTARGLRLGEQDIKVSGSGLSATLRVTITPQRQLMGSYAPTGESGSNISLLVTGTGNVIGWGRDSFDHLGLGVDLNTQASLPVLVPGSDGAPLGKIASVFGGEEHAMAVTESGNVLVWGEYPELARSDRTRLPSLVRNAANDGPLRNIVQVASGWTNAAALTDDGRVYTWGYYHGQGTGDLKNYPNLVQDPSGSGPLSGIVAIASGRMHTLALSASGKVYAWGWNQVGQTGRGNRTNPAVSVEAVRMADGSELSDVVAISAGVNFSLALRADGTVAAWGDNAFSQLGQGKSYGEYHRAVLVKNPQGTGPLTGITMVAGGNNHALALHASGHVLSWGFGLDEALGEGPNRDRANPALPGRVVSRDATGELTGIVAIGAAQSHNFAIHADGTVLAWGDGYGSALGQGTITNSDSPVPVAVKNAAGTGSLVMPLARYHNLQQRGRN